MANTYDVKNGIRNGAVGGFIAGLVMAIPMLVLLHTGVRIPYLALFLTKIENTFFYEANLYQKIKLVYFQDIISKIC